MRTLVGIDLTAHPERHTIVPEGVDLAVVDRARRPRRRPTPAAPSRGGRCAELRRLVADPARRASRAAADRQRRPAPPRQGHGDARRGVGRRAALRERAQPADRRRRPRPPVPRRTRAARPHRRRRACRPSGPPPGCSSRATAPTTWSLAGSPPPGAGLPGLSAPGGVYACASLKEEFGIALLEAMARGPARRRPRRRPARHLHRGRRDRALTATVDVDRPPRRPCRPRWTRRAPRRTTPGPRAPGATVATASRSGAWRRRSPTSTDGSPPTSARPARHLDAAR